MMDLAQPSYIQSDYMIDPSACVAGVGPQGTIAGPQMRETNQPTVPHHHALSPDHYKTQSLPIPGPNVPLPYSYRSRIAPYTLNYPYADDESRSLAWGALDASQSSRQNPFRTALATSSLVILGAIVGEMILGKPLQQFLASKSTDWYGDKGLPTGYGALVGAITANALRMGVATGLYDGLKPALSATAGGLIPIVLPLTISMWTGYRTGGGTTKGTETLMAVSGLAFLIIPVIYVIKQTKEQ